MSRKCIEHRFSYNPETQRFELDGTPLNVGYNEEEGLLRVNCWTMQISALRELLSRLDGRRGWRNL